MWVRNTLSVLAGLAVALTIILLAITANKAWFDELGHIELARKADVFIYWQSVLKQAPDNFFIALLISCGIGAMIGGVTTAFLVKKARQAYAILVGALLFSGAVIDIFIFKHPTWYQISLILIFFPCAWLGGKIVDVLIQNKIMHS
ncbi:hypothetical protein GO491_05450 [Flavobacteriaceae bacterium Ap0902]|nr:hypothetical protein [Flavobacteriaceae bacterium Ap0902]